MLFVALFLFGGIGVYTISLSRASTPVNITAATYNILGQHHDPKKVLDVWDKRRSRVANRIAQYNPGIIGLQEVTRTNPLNGKNSVQRADVVRFMTAQDYDNYTGSAKNNSPIFWKKDNFKVLAEKEVLIIPQNSKLEGPAARYLTYVRLQKGAKKISVFNYHYNQYRDDTKQLEKIKKAFNSLKKAGDSVIFTGDFNRRDLQVRNYTGLWRVDLHTASSNDIDHVLASQNVSRISWKKVPRGTPAASDHPLIGVYVTLN